MYTGLEPIWPLIILSVSRLCPLCGSTVWVAIGNHSSVMDQLCPAPRSYDLLAVELSQLNQELTSLHWRGQLRMTTSSSPSESKSLLALFFRKQLRNLAEDQNLISSVQHWIVWWCNHSWGGSSISSLVIWTECVFVGCEFSLSWTLQKFGNASALTSDSVKKFNQPSNACMTHLHSHLTDHHNSSWYQCGSFNHIHACLHSLSPTWPQPHSPSLNLVLLWSPSTPPLLGSLELRSLSLMARFGLY